MVSHKLVPMTCLCSTKVKYCNIKVPNLKMPLFLDPEPAAPVHFACTGWDTYPALLALLALKVLLNATHKVKSCKEVSHLTKSVGHLTRYPSWSC